LLFIKKLPKKRQEAQRLSHAPRKLAVPHSLLLEGKAVHYSIPMIITDLEVCFPSSPCQEGGGVTLLSFNAFIIKTPLNCQLFLYLNAFFFFISPSSIPTGFKYDEISAPAPLTTKH